MERMFHSEVDTRCFELIPDDDMMTDHCEICGALIKCGEDFCEECKMAVFKDLSAITAYWERCNCKINGVIHCVEMWIEEQ